jgi:hypothetical protein
VVGAAAREKSSRRTPVSAAVRLPVAVSDCATASAMSAASRPPAAVPVTEIIGASGEVAACTWGRRSATARPVAAWAPASTEEPVTMRP